MRYETHGKLDVARAAKLLLTDVDLSNPAGDDDLLARMPAAKATRLKLEHSGMIRTFRQHAAAICAVCGIPVPYIVDRVQDLASPEVFEQALMQYVRESDAGEQFAPYETGIVKIPKICDLYKKAIQSCGEHQPFFSWTGAREWVVRTMIYPPRVALDMRSFLVNGHPLDPQDQQDDIVQKWGTLYHELGHELFPSAWSIQKLEYDRLGRGKECPDQPLYDGANGELMADTMAMAFMTRHFGHMGVARDWVAHRLLGCLRGSEMQYWNALSLMAFLPKLTGVEKLDNAGIIALLEKQRETSLWTEKSFKQNLKSQLANIWVPCICIKKDSPSLKDTYASAPAHIHDCVEALCHLYKASPAEMGIRPDRPAVPALRPQI